MKKNLLRPLLLALMVLVGGSAWAGDKTVVKYSFDDAMSPSLNAGSRVGFDYDKTSVITSTKFLNAWNNTNGDPGATTVSLGNTDLSGETWTLSFEWAACGGCNSKADHTTLKAGDTNLFDLTGNSNWNTTVTITYAGSDGTKTLPVPGCDKNKRFKADVGDQLNTTAYWHHIVVTGSASGVTMTITNSSTGTAVVEDVLLSETNVNPTSLIIEPCCGGAIGIDELSLTYFVEGEVIQTPTANYTAVNGIERTITATCDTEGATLYYSTDGENWTEGASVTVSASGNVYFKAVKGNSESDVLTFAAVAGEAITLNAPTIVRSDNTTVTISADQTDLLLSPTATITYEYGNEKDSFTGSKVLTVSADAIIAAYAEAIGYATSETAELAVALFPTYVNQIENTPAKTSGWSSNAFSEATKTASERTYAALLLDEAQWGTNIYLQTTGAWGLRASGNWYINSDTQESWILMPSMKKGDIIVVDATYPASNTVNATYSKYSYGTKHAYEVTEDGDVEIALKKINASTMDYLYGVYAYSPMSEEEIAAIKAFEDAKAALQAAINEAKAIDTTDKEGVDALNTAISTAEEALSAENATVESLTNAKNALAEAVAAFEEANKPAFDPATAIVNADFNPEADPLGWDKVTSAQYYDLGMGLIGTYQVRGEHPAATVDETHLATEFAAGLECRWQTNYAAFTQTTAELPAGAYKLTFDVENTNATTTKANYENRFNVTVGETTYADESTEWMNGKSAWTTHTIAFTLTEASPITISLGYGTGSNNFGVGNTPALFVSHLNLETISALDLALIDLKAAIDAAKAKLASYPVGDVYFTYPASELAGLAFLIGIAEGTYNAAESVEAVKEATKNLNDYVATFAPIMQIPTEGKAYYIANKTAEGNLCIGTEKVTIAKDAAVFFTKAEGGFVLSNEEGNYILKTAANNWTLSTTANKDEAYVVNFNLVDGAYTIQGAKGLFGTDNATEGSEVYANKAQANNGLWTITAVPEFKPAYGTLWTEADGYSETEEPEPYKYIVLDNKYFKNLAKAGDTIKVAISSVGNQAEGSRSLIITTGKLEMNIGNDGQNTDIQQGTTSYEFTLDANEIEKIQDGADVILKWKYMTVAQVELTEFKKTQLINNGTYYIAAAEKISSDNPTYMAAGNAWGTHGIVNEAGLDLDITYNEASKDYYIDTRISNGGNNHYLGSGLYMDAPAFGWKIEEVTNGFNIYGMFDGVKKYVSAANDGNLVLSETPYPWIFIHISNWNSVMNATLNEATAENGVDATFLLKNPNFNRNDQRVAAWVVSEDCTNKNLGGGCTEGNGNACAESYHSTFTISQIAEGAPKGIYAVTAQGFYRQDTEGDFALPYFFANDEKANFPLRTGTENSMTDAGVSFTNGLYTIDPIYVEVAENGTLTVGTKSETANFWCIWDNFKLTYYGANATMDEVKNGAIVKELAELRAKAQNMLADIEVDAVKNAINDALTATADVTGADAINAAIATMKAAIEKGEASIIAKNTLPKMKQLTEETNLYTAEALNTYYTQWEVKYLDGSLTKTEATTNLQDPFLVTTWRANAVANTLLMSAWDETPMNWNSYHLNTWSTEGSTDGSNFVVPFIEYWTGDGESLAEKTLTATMNDVQKGIYDVTAWVRVRIKNGAAAPATGIFFQVNDQTGESVVGEQLGNTQFYLKEMATKATVDTDGKLTIKFNVAADNNISWLAFKNVKFILDENATVGITNVNNAKNANDAIYNLNGQKVQKAQKGLYIINGKKTVVK
jgi:hypothetical protein